MRKFLYLRNSEDQKQNEKDLFLHTITAFLLSVCVSGFLKVLVITLLSQGLISIQSTGGAEAPHSLPGDIGSQQQPRPQLSLARSGHSIRHIVRAITSLICLRFLKSRHGEKGNVAPTQDIPELKNSRGASKECATDIKSGLQDLQQEMGLSPRWYFYSF